MDRSEIEELHFITPIANLDSVMLNGIVSHNRAQRLQHVSVANENVQNIRAQKNVPGGLVLHDYANLYIDARNPMMYAIKDHGRPLAVLCVSPDVLDLAGVVIADGNAASIGTRFAASPEGLAILVRDRVRATWWTSADFWDQAERKRQRCAEVLVPHVVPPRLILKAKVLDRAVLKACDDAGIRGEVNANVFFQ